MPPDGPIIRSVVEIGILQPEAKPENANDSPVRLPSLGNYIRCHNGVPAGTAVPEGTRTAKVEPPPRPRITLAPSRAAARTPVPVA